MEKTKIKIIRLDGDALELKFVFDEELQRYFGAYPDFSIQPRYTPLGRPWVNVTDEDCPYCKGEYGDCGSCPYLVKEHEKDLIGICIHESKRDKQLQNKECLI